MRHTEPSSTARACSCAAWPAARQASGAETIYDQQWIYETPAEMASFIASLAAPDAWRAAGQAAREQARAFELGSVCRTWHRLLTANLAPGEGDPVYQLTGSG